MTMEKGVAVTGGCNASRAIVVISVLFFISVIAVTVTITLIALDRTDKKGESGEFDGVIGDGGSGDGGSGDEGSGYGGGETGEDSGSVEGKLISEPISRPL